MLSGDVQRLGAVASPGRRRVAEHDAAPSETLREDDMSVATHRYRQHWPLNAFALSFALIAGLAPVTAFAFSQIVTEETGQPTETREGIVAVPLPPLPGTAAESTEGDASSATIDGETLAPGQPTDQEGPLPVPPATATGEPGPAAPTGEQNAPATPLPASDAPAPKTQPLPADTAPVKAETHATTGLGADESPTTAMAEPLASSGVRYEEQGLPAPVRDLRRKLMEIARSGDVEALRPYIDTGEDGTVLSFGGPIADPIAHLKSLSGDGEGLETLAIMLELLESGHMEMEPGSENAIFVWPYFAQTRIDSLTKPQLVELFEIVTSGDYQAMLDFGAYNFFRLGITPEGRLAYFVSGD